MELKDDTDTLKGDNAQEEDFNQMNRLLEKLYNKLDSPTALERVKTCIVWLFLEEKNALKNSVDSSNKRVILYNTFRHSGILVNDTDSQRLADLLGIQNYP